MKKTTFFAILALLSALTFVPPVVAEWFDGEVEKVDLKAKTVTVTDIDPITEAEEHNEIVVTEATVFSGVKSLRDLKSGDDVTIEAQYDEPTDAWKALSLEMAEAGE